MKKLPTKMKTKIHNVLGLRNLFNINKSHSNIILYNLNRPGILLLNNIYMNWLKSVNSKTQKYMPIFTNKKCFNEKQTLPYGYFANNLIKYDDKYILEYNIEDCTHKHTSKLELNLVVPQTDTLQYFIQWQRYRKYWWSSITTTPSLFKINENGDENTQAEVVAQFPWGNLTVETISTHSEKNQNILKCSLTLEHAMLTLLLDGHNNTREGFLRLHRNMAPYKISFALQAKETSTKNDLTRLAKLMYYKLKSKGISACAPDFTLSYEHQIEENLQLGVAYTAILNGNTQVNGIFHLLNSNTMLKEEVHVADFVSYADLLCKT